MTERKTEAHGRLAGGPRLANLQSPCSNKRPQTAHSAGQRHLDKIANRGAGLQELRAAISGRCWVRTNVG